MKSKHEIPNKTDFMKAHSFNFIQNEIGNSDLIHGDKSYKHGQGGTETPSISKNQDVENQKMEKENSSRTHESLIEKSETSIVTDSRTDYTGSAPKRYTTKCYITLAPIPIWYTESVSLTIGSTRRRYEEKVYIKNKLRPYKWSESMSTEVKTMPKNIISDIYIPVEDSDIHFMSLEPQQIAAGAN
uniref:Uncharacterized protein n=1 Tax=Anoplophora glabripennis TaxID=217634 RepID=V5GU35_ANOGL